MYACSRARACVRVRARVFACARVCARAFVWVCVYSSLLRGYPNEYLTEGGEGGLLGEGCHVLLGVAIKLVQNCVEGHLFTEHSHVTHQTHTHTHTHSHTNTNAHKYTHTKDMRIVKE